MRADDSGPGGSELSAGLGPLPAATLECWRINYGLDRTPHELAAMWGDSAPSGAVLALRAAVIEIERLAKSAKDDVAAEREPLNFDQLHRVMSQHFGGRELTDDEADSAEAFARAVERAHGIGA